MSDQVIASLGKIITTEQQRDCVHIAIAPVMAAEKLRAGQDVCLDSEWRATVCGTPVGIVDPFLVCGVVLPGERFWLFLYPGTIKSLRHEWEHPAFTAKDETLDVSSSEAWIRSLADDLGIDYEVLMEAASNWLRRHEHLVQRDSETWRDEFPQHAEAFWSHYEIVTGEKIGDNERESFFSCSC